MKIIKFSILIILLLTVNLQNQTIIKEQQEENKSQQVVEEYIENYTSPEKGRDDSDNIPYLAVIEIPKISLIRGIPFIESKENDVDKNIQVITPSNLPDVVNGNLILAAHSGTGKKAIFKNLDKLKLNDEVLIYYNNRIYTYVLENIYEEEKDGSIEIIRDYNRTCLTLITCKPNTKTKQLVFILYQK